MSESAMSSIANNQAVIKRNRFFGMVIILIVVVPMVAAYLIHKAGWSLSSGTTNKGELLQPPIPIQSLGIKNASLIDELYGDSADKKWRFLVPVSAACDEVCQQNLYTSRQVHIRLAEKAYRVERFLIATDVLPADLQQQLEQEHRNTRRLQTTGQQLSTWLSSAGAGDNVQDYYYLVDQEGFAMMRYSMANTGHEVLADIKKLLKFTYDK